MTDEMINGLTAVKKIHQSRLAEMQSRYTESPSNTLIEEIKFHRRAIRNLQWRISYMKKKLGDTK